jgi:predicted lipoprotein with Yx(FWY)xxD motif
VRTAAVQTRTVPGATVTVAASEYGRILMTAKRFALYSLSSDSRARSNCYGACAKRWPPLITRGAPSAFGRARDSLLGTARRRDGSRQVTYRGHPLYRYVGDIEPK